MPGDDGGDTVSDNDEADTASGNSGADTVSGDDSADTVSGNDSADTVPGDGGTYVLAVRLAEPTSIEFGAAGRHDLDAGWYAYTGSAFGPGGLSRVDRHRDLAAGTRDARHWHVDYLLGHDHATIEDVLTVTGVDRECAVARALADGGTVLPLGASDCDCEGHLVHCESVQSLRSVVRSVFET